MDSERKRSSGRNSWLPLWCLAATAFLLALVAGGQLLNELALLDWGRGAVGWAAPALVLALVIAPLLLVPLTVGRRPSAGFSPLIAALCLAVGALGLLAWWGIAAIRASDGGWYAGPGGFGPLAETLPWQFWQGAALAYALCGVLLLAAYAVVTLRGRARRGAEGLVGSGSA